MIAAPHPPNLVLEVVADVFGPKTPPNGFLVMQKNENKAVWVADRLYRIGKRNRIVARVKVDGKLTWRAAKTSKLWKAQKWLEAWDRNQWVQPQAQIPTAVPQQAEPKPADTKPEPTLTVNFLIDQYVGAGHPIVKKRALKRKAPRTVKNETYALVPLREFFGAKVAAVLTLADCDAYYGWRNTGKYISRYKVRGHDVVKKTRGGDRVVDLELTVIRNVLELAVRRGQLSANPFRDRGQYTDESTVRHCREVAPTPSGLQMIVAWMHEQNQGDDADLTEFLAYTGLRIGEALLLKWEAVDWPEKLLHVQRTKKGVFPFVPILPELEALLRRMERAVTGPFLFPALFEPDRPRESSSYRRILGKACKKLKLRHVTPHGLRSYFVTQARQSGLTDAEIAQLIGDKSGPDLIAEVYGDVRPEHLLLIARKIQLTASTRIPTQP
jgi:integrase